MEWDILIISAMVFAVGIYFMLGLPGLITEPTPEEYKLVDCYDKYNNKILGVECQDERGPWPNNPSFQGWGVLMFMGGGLGLLLCLFLGD